MQPSLHPLPELAPGQALWRGVVTALVVVAPAGILNQVAVDRDWLLVALATFPLVMLGGAAGGWTVLRLCPPASLWLAAAASAAAYLLVQGAGVVRRLATGERLSWLAYPFLAVLMATCGMLGGLFARRTTARADRDTERTDGP